MRRYRLVSLVVPIMIAAPSISIRAQQADVSVSPFVVLPGSGAGSLAGLGVAVAGSPGFALRAAARVAFKNTYAGGLGANTWLPPWGADVDAVFALSGRPFASRSRTPATFVFLGLGASARDTADARVMANNWSYGIGTMVPLGAAVDLFVESRWRMSKFVLPTASPKPIRSKELRFGFSLHMQGTNGSPPRRSGGR